MIPGDIDTRLVALILWGGGTVVVFTVVLVKRWRRFMRHRWDRRRAVRKEVRRDVMSSAALELTAVGSAGAIALVLSGQSADFRGFFIALALGAFLGAGLVMASEEDAAGEALARGARDLPPSHDAAGEH